MIYTHMISNISYNFKFVINEQLIKFTTFHYLNHSCITARSLNPKRANYI